MDNYKNYCKSCTVTRIGDFQCSYQGQISVLENFRVYVEILNIKREMCFQIEKNENLFLCIQMDDKLITAKNLYVRKIGSKLKGENFENPCFNFNMIIEALILVLLLSNHLMYAQLLHFQNFVTFLMFFDYKDF